MAQEQHQFLGAARRVQIGALRTASSSSVYDNLDGSTAVLLAFGSSQSKISFSGGVFTVASGWTNHPVVFVSWYGAAYCDWLSMQMGPDRDYSHTVRIVHG